MGGHATEPAHDDDSQLFTHLYGLQRSREVPLWTVARSRRRPGAPYRDGRSGWRQAAALRTSSSRGRPEPTAQSKSSARSVSRSSISIGVRMVIVAARGGSSSSENSG